MATSTPKHLRIGVLVPASVQLLDLSPIDLFAMLDPRYLSECNLPAPLVALGISSTIHYISCTPAATSAPSTEDIPPSVSLTAFLNILPTDNLLSPSVQPGQLDILLLPGPKPNEVFDDAVLGFVRAHAEADSTDVLSICTGCVILAQSGLLKGRKASGPRGFLGELRKRWPETQWVEDRRWVVDGNFWISGEFEILF